MPHDSNDDREDLLTRIGKLVKRYYHFVVIGLGLIVAVAELVRYVFGESLIAALIDLFVIVSVLLCLCFLLFLTIEDMRSNNRRLMKANAEIRSLEQELFKAMTERDAADKKLAELNRAEDLIARHFVEIATGEKLFTNLAIDAFLESIPPQSGTASLTVVTK